MKERNSEREGMKRLWPKNHIVQRRTLQQGRRRQDSDPSVVTLAETTFYLKGSQMSDAGTIVDLSVLDVFGAPLFGSKGTRRKLFFY